MDLATVDNPWLLILAGALGIGLLFGLVAAATRYCNMGAVSDWVLTGDMGRMRAWLLSIAVAIAAVGAFELLGAIDLDQTRVNYRSADFPWLRYLLGGIMFGIGMVLAGGCTTRTLVNIGQGDLKSLWAYLIVGLTALVLLSWPPSRLFVDQGLAWPGIDLASVGIDQQDPGGILAGITAMEAAYLRPATAGLVALGLIAWLWRLDRARRMRLPDVVGGIGIGAVIVLGWLWTGSPSGQALMSEAALAFDPPRGTGTQSLSFVGPAAEALRLAASPAFALVTFGVIAMLGVILGAGFWFAARQQFRLQGFYSWSQFGSYTAGGLLMGGGGIIAMGCSVGQGLSGTSTLALGSLLALGSMILGAWLTLKVMLYRALYPQSSWSTSLCAILADLRLAPAARHPYRGHVSSGERPQGCSK